MTTRKPKYVFARTEVLAKDRGVNDCIYCGREITTVSGYCPPCGEIHKIKCQAWGCKTMINNCNHDWKCDACKLRLKLRNERAAKYDHYEI